MIVATFWMSGGRPIVLMTHHTSAIMITKTSRDTRNVEVIIRAVKHFLHEVSMKYYFRRETEDVMTLQICAKCDKILSRFQCDCGFELYPEKQPPIPEPMLFSPEELTLPYKLDGA